MDTPSRTPMLQGLSDRLIYYLADDDNLEQTLERLKKDGVQVTDEPRSLAGGKVKWRGQTWTSLSPNCCRY